MKSLKKILSLALCGVALTTLPPNIKAEPLFNFSFFPEMPIYRSTIADPDTMKTEIKVPKGLEEESLNLPLKELIPYTTLSKEIAVLSLGIKAKGIPKIVPREVIMDAISRSEFEKTTISDELFSTSLIASGKLQFPNNKDAIYNARAELFAGFPILDDYLSDGNKLILSAGVDSKGSLNLESIANKSVSSLLKSFNQGSYSFFEDVYLVIKSPFNSQFVILKGGFDNLFGNSKEDINFNISATVEFPSPTFWIKELKDSKIFPYVSMALKMPIDSSLCKKIGEVGIKIAGKSEKSLHGYMRAELEDSKEILYFSGLRFDL